MDQGLKFSISSLIVANIITIVLALAYGWDIKVIMVIYWCQSIIIGLFQFLKIRRLKNFSTDGLEINNVPVEPTLANKNFILFFFPVHYGIFHLAYFIFLGLQSFAENSFVLLMPVAIFFVNHYISYAKHAESKIVNIGTLMFIPYLRIIPMHIAIIAGLYLSQTITSLILFMALKTIADVIMHIIEHKLSY